jgi:hypothetical protein
MVTVRVMEKVYRLIIIWYNGERDEYDYPTREEAEEVERGYHMEFGNQISWTGISKRG